MHHWLGRVLRGTLGILSFVSSVAIAQTSSTSVPSFKMDGEVKLLTNYVEYGVTQSDSDPSLQGSFWFNWGPQFRLGLFGSSVGFENSDSRFLLDAMAELRVAFSQNADLAIHFSDHHYFKSETRNGNTVALVITMSSHKVTYESISNFEGSEESVSYVAFQKTFDMSGGWKWENQIGYLMAQSDTFQNYFDVRSMLGIKPAAIFYQGGVTATSNSSQFNGKGDAFVILSATTTF